MKFKSKKGITLVEVVVYLGVFAMIFVTIAQFAIFTTQNNKLAESRKEIEKAKIFLIEHISESFIRSNTIDVSNSIFNNSNGKLRLNIIPSGYVEYSILNNRLNINDSSTNSFLNTTSFIVTNFFLEEIKNSSNLTTGVRIRITISSIKNPNTNSTIQTSFTLK